GEVIFSNVLIDESNSPRWLGDARDPPKKGVTFSGPWEAGMKDNEGKDKPYAHKNARYTISLDRLKNTDKKLYDPKGVEVSGIIYGGRDSDTTVPVEQSFDWVHGIVTKGAILESETTAATIGKEGVRVFNPMSNIDFVSIPVGRYIKDNIEFSKRANKLPAIFSSNYFLKGKDGKYISSMEDKRVWLKWMELRVHGEVDAIKTPTGFIPKFEDLKRLFREVLDRDFSKEAYDQLFTINVVEWIAKIDRTRAEYEKIPETPQILFKVLDEQKKRLEELRKIKGDYVKPEEL
ncbi:MAG: phosphoenolpyruvate carboxykinase domain-containing protein, partial [Candidatus Altiarchaeota archaeon]|nr:phosphoenolpyruvate carboxykinase domain-containing protein [Candidatus Altiarchaeota archaeon]